jgi:DNA (cytosine-5)-methyltransferase 1
VTFIDLFAGIGGMRLGFESAGFACVFSSEWDKYAQQTYQANFNETPHGDITQIPAKDIPPHDILLAGFPCQPFSNAGLKKGFDDTRGTLFFDVLRIIHHHGPKVVFLENVKGLVSHDKGRTLEVILERLKSCGYTVYWKVLNAKDFGVPQNRQRIYIIAFRENVLFSWPQPPCTPTRLGDVLEREVDKKYYLTDKQWTYHQERKARHKAKGNGFGYSSVDADSPYAHTLSARYYKDGSEILIKQDNANPRRLTPRECARLQGFPDSFIIPVSDTQAYKQFGNSVAVLVIKALAHKIKETLEADNPTALHAKRLSNSDKGTKSFAW